MLTGSTTDTSNVESILKQLTADGFELEKDIVYNNHFFICMARRKKFGSQTVLLHQTFIFLAELPSIDKSSIRDYSSDCRRYIRKYRLLSLILWGAILCYPIVVINNASSSTMQLIREAKTKTGIGYIELPAIVDLANNEVISSKHTPYLGHLALPYAREMLNDLSDKWFS